MALTNQDRDELLVDLLEGLTYITGHLEFKNKLRSNVMHDKLAYYKKKLLGQDEDELPTCVGLGMYDEGDYVMINVDRNTYKGKIISRINYDQAPGYKVMSLVDESEVWIVKEKDISKRIPTSMPPPPPKKLPLPPKIPDIIDGDIENLAHKSKIAPPPLPLPPPPPPLPLPILNRNASIPPPPLLVTDDDMKKIKEEAKKWIEESIKKVRD